jgi:nuclear transport factor 2 (NTF2) superfamily protein
MELRHPIPPFTEESAKAYTIDSEWRNRHQFINGRGEIISFLTEKWQHELDYKLVKEYWAHTSNRIAVRFVYEFRNAAGQWFRAYGNENWEFDENGLMRKRYASINDLPINEADRILIS